MVKKKKDLRNEAEMLAAERTKYIKDFNLNNAGKMRIEPDKVPTEDDIKNAKEEYEARVKALQEKKDYFIADKENALRVANFLKTYNETNIWVGTPTQPLFVGVLKFHEYITKFIEECEKEPKDLVMEYAPMQFCFIAMSNYCGIGLDGADHMAKIWDEFIPIYDALRDNIEYYKSEVEACNMLNDRWALMTQGFYTVILKVNEEQTIENENNKSDKDIIAETSETEVSKNNN